MHLFDVHHPYESPEPWASRAEHPYYGEVAWVDHLVETALSGLRERGELENTWVFVMADHGEGLGSHGEGLGSHGEALHGVLLYDATTRVPLIIRPPEGLESARKVDFPVSLVDVLPTVLELAGVPWCPGSEPSPQRPCATARSPWRASTPGATTAGPRRRPRWTTPTS
ncbi:MAG: sulfatase-like hydrolase/transferase [Deltaproteobacteria bacterium]|nr:sulfatase-like hydrolase/transferase [Deltaproteobacteria bacterium]